MLIEYEVANLKKARILLFGDPLLRQRSDEVTVFHKTLQSKIEKLKYTLFSSENGAALAAPQIGLMKRITVIDYMDEYLELVNPVIVSSEGLEESEEGCLSLPGYTANVKRAISVTVKYQDRFGNSCTISRSNEMARCLQHEIDHLDGILYIDHVSDQYVTAADGSSVDLREILKAAGSRPE